MSEFSPVKTMKSTKAMHDVALATAIKNGPRIITINGEERAVFGLNQIELKRLFAIHGYNPDRITWRKAVNSWGDTSMWGEITPEPKIVLNKESVGWWIVFVNLAASDLFRLRRYAEDNGVHALPWDSNQLNGRMDVCRSSA